MLDALTAMIELYPAWTKQINELILAYKQVKQCPITQSGIKEKQNQLDKRSDDLMARMDASPTVVK